MAHAPPVPCPVKLGNLRNESPEAQLHQQVKEGNFIKVKKLLKKGTSVHTVNSLGQTPLFTAALLGNGKLVDILLDYGSDPNHRCYDGSTPVHAAAFSGNQLILSKLLDAGGDLRVHDRNGKNPQSWALTAGTESSTQMLEFIQRCTMHMQAALQSYSLDQLRKVGSAKDLVCHPSTFGGITQGTTDSPLGRFLKRRGNVSQNIFSFGFGKFYLTSSRQLGYLASLPIIADKEVVQADDEPTFSFPTGPYMMMTNLMWGGSRVTVKELNMKPHQHCSKLRLCDLLLAEQEYSSKLRHPHLLQLMAVCVSSNLEKTRLVFERVTFGTLYSILHERRSEFPIVHMETIVHLLLQVNDGLRFLHSRGYVHRTFSSYAVMIVMAGEAKLTNLEYMIESKDGGEHSDLTRVPIPSQMYKWCAPEVILERAATDKSDIYSFCTVMQEALTETVPWAGLEGSAVKDLIISGQWLEADARVPKPYYDVVKTGLESRQKQRTLNLQDIRYILKNDLKDLMESRRNRPGENCGPPKMETRPDINICLPSASAISGRMPELQEEEDQEARSFTVSRCAVSAPETEAAAAHETEPFVRLAQSSPILDLAPGVQGAAIDESLSSFEINEIYTCYSELGGESLEEEEGAELDTEARRESETAPGDRAEVPSPPPEEIQSHRTSCSEEGVSSDSNADGSTEELSDVSASSPVHQAVMCASSRARLNQSPFEQKFAKCVLDLKICQTMVQEATASLCRTEEKLDEVEARRKRQLSHPGEQWGVTDPLKNYSVKVDTILSNIKVPYFGDRAFLWKAVGPPSKNYIPPPLRDPGAYRPLIMPSVQTPGSGVKSGSRSQDTTCWSDFGSEAAQSLEDGGEGTEPNYQLLHPGVSIRRRKNTSPQPPRRSATVEGIKAADGLSSKSTPKICEASLRSEQRRMAQSEWTTEVKQMAKKAASGQLGLLEQYPPSGWTSESEGESTKDEFQSTNDEQIRFYRRNAEAGRLHAVRGLGDQKLGSDYKEGSDPETVSKRSEGSENQSRSSQFPGKKALVEWGVTSRKNAALSVTAENLCRGQLEEPAHSPSSSPDASEEFLTPDTFFSCSPGLHEHSEAEISTAEEGGGERGLGISQDVLGKKEHPIEAGGKQLTCGMEAKHPKYSPGGDLSTPAARSLSDIQDLSSISCEDSWKRTAYKTPGSTHSPTDASTPRSPAAAPPAFPSTATKYKDCSQMTLDMTRWDSQETSLFGLSAFMMACARGKTAEAPLAPIAAGHSEPAAFSDPEAQLTLRRGQEDSGETPPVQQSEIQEGMLEYEGGADHCQILKLAKGIVDKNALEYLALSLTFTIALFMPAVPEPADSEDQELEEITLNKCRADCSLCTNETLCLVDETERAHSSLDDVLEGVLWPIPDSHELHEELQDPSKREPGRPHRGNLEMKAGAEERFSESEGSARNVEGLDL
ncbi:inactive serine/threonine-protein kinase TEX14 [Elgaria multicarinata webbii]|uniref:inactive serine/threonine-protein kinase TEX14 n=1 Tax=Elgaria multicarinata webbii TaxID=159646 RepID=UPI002FCCFC12